MPDTLHRKNLVIIGCGASAVIVLAALAKQIIATNAPLFSITMIDDNPAAPRGLAYGCNNPSLILNVPAQRMGIYADNPAHFYQWLQHSQVWRQLHPDFALLHIGPDDFAPRMIYGEYVNQQFREAIKRLEVNGHRVALIAQRAVNVKVASRTRGLQVITDQGINIAADRLIIATGNSSSFQNPVVSDSIFPSPYCVSAQQCDWKKQRDLLVIGSGLSMVDAVQTSIAHGFNGRFHIFSARNLLPLPHINLHQHHQLPPFQTHAQSAAELVSDIRRYIKSNQQRGIAWQDSINQLRTGNNHIWSNLPERARTRLRKCLPWWNIARHRIPVDIAQHLDALKSEGRLLMYKAKIKRIDAVNNGFHLTPASNEKLPAYGHAKIKIVADRAVICAGYSPGFCSAQLLCNELLKTESELRAVLGKPEQNFRLSANYEIYGIGPALGGVLFETTAIPEIRQQAAAITTAILDCSLQYQAFG